MVEKLKTDAKKERSAQEIETQDFNSPDNEDFFSENQDNFLRAGKIISLRLGNLEFGIDPANREYLKLTFKDKLTHKDFEFYTIDPKEISILKSAFNKSQELSSRQPKTKKAGVAQW